MCRLATRTLPHEPRATYAARTFLRERFTEWGLVELLDTAELALSELVTNAILHARTPLSVSLSCEYTVAEIAVFDGDPTPPTVRAPRADLPADLDVLLANEGGLPGGAAGLDDRDPRLHVGDAGSVVGGRGLLLVTALVADWGVCAVPGGKAVWVRLPVPGAWPPAAQCTCGTSGEAVPLPSGHRAVHRED